MVFGASGTNEWILLSWNTTDHTHHLAGVTGWSFVNEFLNDYPKKGVWDGVVAMTNRPLKQEDSLWPTDSRLQIVSGVDLLASQDEIESTLKEKVRGVDEITHVFYLGEQDRNRLADTC